MCVSLVLLNKDDTHTGLLFSPHLYPSFTFSISPFDLNFNFIPLFHLCDLPYFLFPNGKSDQLSSEVALLITEPEGSYQAALRSNRKTRHSV